MTIACLLPNTYCEVHTNDALFTTTAACRKVSRRRACLRRTARLAIILQSRGAENFTELTRHKSYHQETKR